MSIAAAEQTSHHLLPALNHLHQALQDKVTAFDDIVKIGRTHTQDAVPITLGQEFSGYARQVELGMARVRDCLPRLLELAEVGTAVGSSFNAALGFSETVIANLSRLSGLPFTSAGNKFESIGALDALVELSGTLNVLATSLMKIANDIRFL